jgi:hypothetical protein
MSYTTPPPPPGPYGEPPYGAPQGGGQHPRGTLILVLGILSIVCCGLFTGIPAIIMGKSALDEAQTAGYTNAGMIKAGFICGIVGTCLSVLGIIAQVVIYSSR